MPAKYSVDIDPTFLRFDPSSTDFYESISNDIPLFKEYKEHNKMMRLRIFSWIVCMYDMNSPLRREIRDMYKRKVYAATITGIHPNQITGKYKESVEAILLGTDNKVNALIVAFIASFSSPEYMQMIAHVSLQHSIMNKIISGNAKKDDQTMFDTATEKIKGLMNLLYGAGERDEVYEARRALYQQVAADLSDMRPENVAKKMASGEGLPPEWSPYEEGYLPGDINFVSDDVHIAEEDEEDGAAS